VPRMRPQTWRYLQYWGLALVGLVAVLVATDATDSQEVPFGLLGVQPVVSGPTGQTRSLGVIHALYLTQGAALEACEDQADAYARREGWGDHYTYVCCTVTFQDPCRSKIR
jgi:hypothetical protein